MREITRATGLQAAPTPPGAAARRVVAAGTIRRHAGRTLTVRATETGTTIAIAPRSAELLRQVAEHLTTHRPADPMTEAARMTVALRVAGTAPAASPLLRALPFPSGSITRGEYALRLRKAAWAAGGVRRG
ncbi:hypothetical protein [Streptomyces sp. NRRL F-5135]|uniref:hypothetical protein n=1 Tax=Streptomyces sp. NRRL F-5135 TaxID=1463858 RepID=UPI0004CC3AA6|nr:hypothetical protein [Streptomyces sp. NRRL F-5135]